jgi:hypothetical protein
MRIGAVHATESEAQGFTSDPPAQRAALGKIASKRKQVLTLCTFVFAGDLSERSGRLRRQVVALVV